MLRQIRPSVRPSHSGIVSKRMHISSNSFHHQHKIWQGHDPSILRSTAVISYLSVCHPFETIVNIVKLIHHLVGHHSSFLELYAVTKYQTEPLTGASTTRWVGKFAFFTHSSLSRKRYKIGDMIGFYRSLIGSRYLIPIRYQISDSVSVPMTLSDLERRNA